MAGRDEALLGALVECSERVRQAIIGAERGLLARVVGMGADGAETSGIDRIAEDAALAFFDARGDGWNVLSEEVGLIDRGSAVTLILDPIDSTSNATAAAELTTRPPAGEAHAIPVPLPPHSNQYGFPYYAFSVAALVDGVPAAACVRNLPTGDLFTAVRGGGSRLNGVPVRCEPVEAVRGAWTALVRPADAETVRRLAPLLLGARRVRITGCTSLDLCLIAAGSLHAFVNPNFHLPPGYGEKVVDYAGALLILEEAGGVASDPSGRPLPLGLDLTRRVAPVAASTPRLLAALIDAIQSGGGV